MKEGAVNRKIGVKGVGTGALLGLAALLALPVLPILGGIAGAQTEGDLRLRGGSAHRGLLEVYLDGRWGGICYHGFEQRDRDVACRQLGHGEMTEHDIPDRGGSSAVMTTPRCSGSESRLVDCPYSDRPVCFPQTVSVIRCAAQPNVPATGAPTISGTAAVGSTLTAGTSGISDGNGMARSDFAFTYQWLADGAAIEGATNSTHRVKPEQQGREVAVRVTFMGP